MKFLLGLALSTYLGSLLCSYAVAEESDDNIVLTNVNPQQPAKTQPPGIKIYKYTSKDGVISFSDRAPMRTRYEVVSYSCYACNPKSSVDWYQIPLHLNAFNYPIASAAKKYGVDPALVRAVIHAESAFKPDAVSRKGAKGLMQLMPATAKDMGVVDVMSPAQNIQGGVRYLAWLLERNAGNTMLATASYNAGPGAVKRHNGIPPYAETQTYVKRVKILYERYRKELNPPEELVSVSHL